MFIQYCSCNTWTGCTEYVMFTQLGTLHLPEHPNQAGHCGHDLPPKSLTTSHHSSNFWKKEILSLNQSFIMTCYKRAVRRESFSSTALPPIVIQRYPDTQWAKLSESFTKNILGNLLPLFCPPRSDLMAFLFVKQKVFYNQAPGVKCLLHIRFRSQRIVTSMIVKSEKVKVKVKSVL